MTAELRIYRGLPASGKTTLAKAWVAADPGYRARVNRDDLRAMLHGGYVDGGTEHRAVTKARDGLIGALLAAGISVVNDDTNLSQRRARDIARIGRKAGATLFVSDLTDVPLDLCIARDDDRRRSGERSVGEKVIREMHERYLAGRTYPLPPLEDPVSIGDLFHWTYTPDPTLPPAWMVDLDGTLALMGERSPFDWHRVGEDRLNEPVAEMVDLLGSRSRYIVVLSGRDASCRVATEDWLNDNGVEWDVLLMRPEGDMRKDAVVKLELFREQIAPRYRVLGVLDDRDQVVEMWRSIGLFCAQVAPGAF